MRHFAILLGAALAAGCSTTSYDFGGTLIPAHTVRYYAPMSLPAFAADGSMYVANGDTLLLFSAGGAPLSSSVLPVDFAAYEGQGYVWPSGHATPAGDVFIALDRERIGLLGADQRFAWIKSIANAQSAPIPMAQGLLVERWNGVVPSVAYCNLTGDVRWSVPGSMLWPSAVQVDEQGRAYFCDMQSLSVMPASGVELLRASIPQASQYQDTRLLHARAERVLLRTGDSVTCFNLSGEILWELTPPDGLGDFQAGLVLGADRYVLQAYSWSGGETSQPLLIVDGLGGIIHELQNNPSWQIAGANATGFIAVLYDGKPKALGMFDADGVQLWSKPLPQPATPYAPISANHFAVYPFKTGPVFGADGMIYYTVDNTLYAIDLQGQPLWQATGASFHDEWHPDSYAGDVVAD